MFHFITLFGPFIGIVCNIYTTRKKATAIAIAVAVGGTTLEFVVANIFFTVYYNSIDI